MAKMKVPADLGELKCEQFGGESWTYVPDDLLRERFAFAGSIVLTREEATQLLKAVWAAWNEVDDGETPQWFSDARHMLESKLASEKEAK